MKIVTRYLFQEILPPFFVGIILLTFVILLEELFELTELVVNKGVPFTGIIKVLLLQIPDTFTLTVPMSFTIAVLMAYGRMNADNEILVLRSSGFSLQQLIIPPLLLGIVLSASLLTIKQWGLPQISSYKSQILSELKLTNPLGLMHPKTYTELPPYTIYADEIDDDRLTGIYLEDRGGEHTRIIYSERGRWTKSKTEGFQLELRNGTLHQKSSDDNYRVLNFDRQVIHFDPSSRSSQSETPQNISLYTHYKRYTSALNKYNRLHKKLQNSANNLPDDFSEKVKHARQDYLKIGTEFQRGVAIPFSTFFLVWVTVPLGMWFKQSRNTINLTLSVAIILLYYLLMTFVEPLAMHGLLAPGLAMWIPNAFFGLTGALFYLKLRRRS